MSYSNVVWIDDPFFIKRQRVQIACSFCRQRKIRCDGITPCGNCQKYSTNCVKVKLERPSRATKKNSNNTKNCNDSDNIDKDINEDEFITAENINTTDKNNIFSTATNALNLSLISSSPFNYRINKRPNDDHDQLPQSLPPFQRSIQNNNNDDDRDDDGDNDNNHPSIKSSQLSNSINIMITEPKIPLLNKNQFFMPNDELFEHLLDLYWTNVHPNVPVLNKSLFLQQLNGPNDQASPLLLNAMFAISSDFSEIPSVRLDSETNESSGWLYFDRARNMLDDFLDAPRMSTIAALILMSIFQQRNTTRRSIISAGYFRRWMYIGIAIRMALELELNKECNDDNNQIDNSVKELRKRLWWSLFMLDVLVCCGIGKTSHIDEIDCTISDPNVDMIDEPELRNSSALIEFIQQIKFTKLLHLLLKYNFTLNNNGHDNNNNSSSNSSNSNTDNSISNNDNIDNIDNKSSDDNNNIKDFENQINSWFWHLPKQSTNTLVENFNDYSTTMLHLNMLYHSFIIILHRRYITSSFDSFLKCSHAAANIMPIGDLILSRLSKPFRGFLNCTIWCLLQAGLIHAINQYRGNGDTSRVAKQYYDRIVDLFEKNSQFTASQALQDQANACSSKHSQCLSMIDIWNLVDNNHCNNINNNDDCDDNGNDDNDDNDDNDGINNHLSTEISRNSTSDHSQLYMLSNITGTKTTSLNFIIDDNEPLENSILNNNNNNNNNNNYYKQLQALNYGGNSSSNATATTTSSPATAGKSSVRSSSNADNNSNSSSNTNIFEITHLTTHISTPYPSPTHGAISPMISTTPHVSPNVDLGQFATSSNEATTSPDELFNPFPVLGNDEDHNNWFNGSTSTNANNNSQNHPNHHQTGSWNHHHNQQNYYNNNNNADNYIRPSLTPPTHPTTPTSSPIRKLSLGMSSPSSSTTNIAATTNNNGIFYNDGSIIHLSPTTSPFDSPNPGDSNDTNASPNIDNRVSTSSSNTNNSNDNNYITSSSSSPPPSSSSNNHDSESCGSGYIFGSFNGLGICSN